MSEVVFEAWPSTPRLYRDMVITEKIDGTNACVVIGENGEFCCQSRKRLIWPDDDNFGFARWAFERADELIAFLGPGRHFGEWWGKGIHRGYDRDDRTFSLFNVGRWDDKPNNRLGWPDGLSVVPVLYRGDFSTAIVEAVKHALRFEGSKAAPGYMNPEGVIVWHQAARAKFKSTFDEFDRTGGKSWNLEVSA